MYGIYPPTYSELLKLFPEESIYAFYLGHCIIGKHFLSHFRGENTESMILSFKDDKIYWKDFGKADGINHGRALDLVRALFNLDYQGALKKIFEDLSSSDIYIPIVDKKETSPLTKQIKYKKILPKYILDFYAEGGVSKETLELFNTYHCTEFRFNNTLWHKSVKEDWMVVYMFSPEYSSWQVYRPFADFPHINKKKKFRLNNTQDVISGYRELPPYSDIIIITKSNKDKMVNYEIGYPSVTNINETDIMESYQIAALKRKCKHLVYIGDNDAPGKAVQKMYSALYGIPTFEFDTQKDPFDFVKKNGKQELIYYYKNLFKWL